MQTKIRLVIVDDHPVVREGLQSMLSREQEVELVEVCSSGEAALRCVLRRPVEVSLVDMRMSPMSGVQLIRRAQRGGASCKWVLLSSYELDEEIFQAVEAGASGFVSKNASPREIVDTIRRAYAGETVFPSHLFARIEQRRRKRSLTARELEILEMVAKGLTNKEIGGILGISQFTVRNQLASVSAKLETADRTESARIAIEQGIILL